MSFFCLLFFSSAIGLIHTVAEKKTLEFLKHEMHAQSSAQFRSFVERIKAVFDEHSVDHLINRFFFAFNLTIMNCEDELACKPVNIEPFIFNRAV